MLKQVEVEGVGLEDVAILDDDRRPNLFHSAPGWRDRVDHTMRSVLPILQISARDLNRLEIPLRSSELFLGLTTATLTAVWIMWWALALPLLIATAVSTSVFLGVPLILLRLAGMRREEQFLDQLPEAIDMICRGLRAGLPVRESISLVAEEFRAPVGPYFALIRDSVGLGWSLPDALREVAGRVAIRDFNFLAISISVQRETGGNLAELLSNLSRLLRDRRQVKMKVKALTAEGRASAWIFCLLPLLLSVVLTAINPGYLAVFLEHPSAQAVLFVSIAGVVIGVVVMARMVRIKI